MNNQSTLLVLRRNWTRGLAALFFVLGVTALVTALTPPTYSSEAKVYVATGTGASVEALTAGGQFSQNIVASLAQVVQTPIVTDRVSKQLGGTVTSGEVAQRLSVTSSTDTVLISITATDRSPAGAATIANAAASALSEVAPSLAAGSASNAVPVDVTVVQPAVLTPKPTSPDLTLNTALGLVAGSIFALLVIALSEATRTRVRTDEEVESLTQVPLIGHIPFDSQASAKSLFETASTPLMSERYRFLRASLRYVVDMTARPAIMITSSIEGEGKSTIVANLAIALAGIDLKVLVVDADLRRPRIDTLLGLDGSVGLSDVLAQSVVLEKAIQQSEQPGLDVLPSGDIPPNPSELLSGTRWKEIIVKLKATYDIVLIDTPPTIPVSDPTLVASEADHVLFVVSTRGTRRAQVAAAVRKLDPALRSAGAMSTIINMASESEYESSYQSVPRANQESRRLRPLVG